MPQFALLLMMALFAAAGAVRRDDAAGSMPESSRPSCLQPPTRISSSSRRASCSEVRGLTSGPSFRGGGDRGAVLAGTDTIQEIPAVRHMLGRLLDPDACAGRLRCASGAGSSGPRMPVPRPRAPPCPGADHDHPRARGKSAGALATSLHPAKLAGIRGLGAASGHYRERLNGRTQQQQRRPEFRDAQAGRRLAVTPCKASLAQGSALCPRLQHPLS